MWRASRSHNVIGGSINFYGTHLNGLVHAYCTVLINLERGADRLKCM